MKYTEAQLRTMTDENCFDVIINKKEENDAYKACLLLLDRFVEDKDRLVEETYFDFEHLEERKRCVSANMSIKEINERIQENLADIEELREWRRKLAAESVGVGS